MTTLSISGRQVGAAESVIAGYIDGHSGTVRAYDLFPVPVSARRVDLAIVAATRKMNSKISHAQAGWFTAVAVAAPWDLVPVSADLRQADPEIAGGLWDDAAALYSHFYELRPSGVAVAKIHKVLHLLRPQLYPILDGSLLKLYRPPARRAADAVRTVRPSMIHRGLWWAAICADLIANTQALATIRGHLGLHGNLLQQEVADTVSDLRLLDMASWSVASGKRLLGLSGSQLGSPSGGCGHRRGRQ